MKKAKRVELIPHLSHLTLNELKDMWLSGEIHKCYHCGRYHMPPGDSLDKKHYKFDFNVSYCDECELKLKNKQQRDSDVEQLLNDYHNTKKESS